MMGFSELTFEVRFIRLSTFIMNGSTLKVIAHELLAVNDYSQNIKFPLA